MIISFTGTREGMTPIQMEVIKGIIATHKPTGISHGDCIGADEQFHELAVLAGVRNACLRPGMNWKGETPTRANCHRKHINLALGVAIDLHEPAQYLTRDALIVSDGQLLVAAPVGPEVQRGSGTWATVRIGRRAYKRILIAHPDGSITPENFTKAEEPSC